MSDQAPVPLTKICVFCGATFVRKSGNTRQWLARRFCSRACSYAQGRKNRAPFEGPHLRSDPAYGCWHGMIDRCRRPKSTVFAHYGGRGIRVAREWIGKGGFARFLAHMGPRPSKQHSIGRINNDGNYEPGNVRWETMSEQCSNKRSNRVLTVGGVPKTLTEAASAAGLMKGTLWYRIEHGWSVERALTEPVQHHSRKTSL